MMQIESITIKTKQMIDDLKAICANFGLGGSPGEYKIITQVFLYKYLSDKFGYEASKVEPSIAQVENVEAALTAMPDEDYEMMLMMLGGNVAKLKKNHYISYLFNHQNDDSMKKADGTPYRSMSFLMIRWWILQTITWTSFPSRPAARRKSSSLSQSPSM